MYARPDKRVSIREGLDKKCTDKSSEDVVQKQSLRVRVHCPSQRDPGLLASRESQSFLPDFGEVAGVEQGQVPLEAALVDDCVRSSAFERI
jgi:hypothetical protein